ncbi:MAG: cytochrome c3 family protein [Planctomycetota bacterium]|jgi:hypothetical protein
MQRSWILLTLAATLAACGPDHEDGLDFDDPLHRHGIQLPPLEPGLPPRYEPTKPPDVYPVDREPPFTKGIFPCSRCHVGGEPVADTRPATPHRTHLDRDLTCADCHNPDDEAADPKVPPVEICFDCHEDLAEEPAPVRDFFARIRQEDGTYVFTRRWQTRDTIPRHGRHAAAGVKCDQCHGEASNEPFAKPKSVALMQLCVDCHAERRLATKCESCHAEIREPQHKNIVLDHAEEQRGCLDCHNPEDRDTLRLANGSKIPYTESYRLCGQCHGPNLRDWKLGLHGKRTGMWDGRRSYLLCVHCHQNPHAPSIPPMRPDPPPARPEDIK